MLLAWRRSGPRTLLLASACGLAACSPSGGDRSLTEAAEARANSGTPDGAPPKPPYAVTLVTPLRFCSAAAALASMKAASPKERAAEALCAATLPCYDAAVNATMTELLADNTTAVEYVNSGTILGSGDQRVSVPVSYYASNAFDNATPGGRTACPK